MAEELKKARERIALLEEAVLWQHRLLSKMPEKPIAFVALTLPSGNVLQVGERKEPV